MTDDIDPIIEAGDGSEILPSLSPGNGTDDSPTVRCPDCGHCFSRDDAAARTFDGTTARWQCPRCGRWRIGIPPSR